MSPHRSDREPAPSEHGPRSGPPVVLVHGIGVSRRYFGPLARVLSTTHRVLVPDLPGFGSSGRPRPALGVAEQAAALERVLDRAGVHEPVLVGHSMGTQVVTELAARRPGAARALVLIGPVVDPAARTALRQAWRLARDSAHEPVRVNAWVLSDYLRAGPRSFFGSLPHMLGYPIEERLADVAEPVLLVRGGRDPIATGPFLQQLAAAAPKAATLEVPGAPHVAMATHPEVVAAACRGPW